MSATCQRCNAKLRNIKNRLCYKCFGWMKKRAYREGRIGLSGGSSETIVSETFDEDLAIVAKYFDETDLTKRKGADIDRG